PGGLEHLFALELDLRGGQGAEVGPVGDLPGWRGRALIGHLDPPDGHDVRPGMGELEPAGVDGNSPAERRPGRRPAPGGGLEIAHRATADVGFIHLQLPVGRPPELVLDGYLVQVVGLEWQVRAEDHRRLPAAHRAERECPRSVEGLDGRLDGRTAFPGEDREAVGELPVPVLVPALYPYLARPPARPVPLV